MDHKMYSKSKNEILNLIDNSYNTIKNQAKYKSHPELRNISYSKESWFNIVDINLIKGEKKLVLTYLKSILRQIVNILKEVKGENLCLRYFSEEHVYAYIYNNMKLLKDLKLDMFFLELFLLL